MPNPRINRKRTAESVKGECQANYGNNFEAWRRAVDVLINLEEPFFDPPLSRHDITKPLSGHTNYTLDYKDFGVEKGWIASVMKYSPGPK